MSKKAIVFTQFVAALFGAAVDGEGAPNEPKRTYGLGEVRTIALSPDLRLMATAGQGGAFLWDIETATLRSRLELNWSATALAFSPDSRKLAVASLNTISIWEPESGRRVKEFTGHKAEISRLRFSGDGETLLSASADNTVRIWSLQTNAEVGSIRLPGSPIVDVAVSPDSHRFATVDTFLTNCVKVWDLATGALVGTLPKTNWTAERCLFTTDGFLLTSEPGRTITLWNSEKSEAIRSFGGITNATATIVDLWLPNDSSLAAVCNDGRVFLWNLNTGELLRVVTGEPLVAAAGAPSDFLVATAQLDYNVRIRQLPGGDTLRTFKGHTTSTHQAVSFSPDGRYVLSGGTEMLTRLWDRRTGQPVREFPGSPAGTAAAVFSADGTRVLTTIGLPSPAARLWNTETGELEREFKWSGGWPTAAIFSPDGGKVATRSQGQSISIFDTSTGKLLQTLNNNAWAAPMTFSPIAPLLAAASDASTADLYNHESGQLLHSFFANAGPVTAVAFSPKGDTLMIAWEDGLIRLYNAFTLELRREFGIGAAFLEDAVYSPDGQYILTGEGWPAFTATLRDAKTGEQLSTFPGHKWSVGAVAFSADGGSILTGADMVREWSVASFAARLRFERPPEGNGLQLFWSLGELQRAIKPQGPWETMTNAASPYTLSMERPASFYRVQVREAALTE